MTEASYRALSGFEQRAWLGYFALRDEDQKEAVEEAKRNARSRNAARRRKGR